MISGLRTLFSLVDPTLRKYWLWLLPLSALCAALEGLGAVAVYGLIGLIGDPSAIESHPMLSGLANTGSAVVVLTAMLAVFFVAKNGLLAILAVGRNRIACRSMAALSSRLFRAYLKAPYAEHLKRNSAELVRNATDSCEIAFESVAKALLVVATEALVVVGLVVVLVIEAPSASVLAIAVLLGGLGLVLRWSQGRLELWGKRTETLKAESIQNLQQSIGGLREVKVMGRGDFFNEHFARLQEELSSLRARGMNWVSAPPLLIETGFVLSMLVVVLLVLGSGAGDEVDLEGGVALLGLYGYVGFRTIPSLHRISMNFNFARFGLPAIENLARDLADFESSPGARAGGTADRVVPFAFDKEIALEKLCFRYEGASSFALEGIDLRISRGESLGVVGRTGSGKSTLVDLLLGLLTATEGGVSVDSRDIHDALPGWQSKLGYVPQDVYLMDDSLLRNVALGMRDDEIDRGRVERALALAQLDGFVRGLPEGLETKVGERGMRLSGGQVQRVAIARALYHEPELIVFDEATSSLDPRTEAEVSAAIENLHGADTRVTLVVVTHRIATVASCDRLIVLEAGKLAGEGRYEDLAAHNPAFQAMLAESNRS